MRTSISMNGLSNMSYLLKVLFIIMGLYSAICLAETHNENDPVTMEFLEFLSEWETEQGDWVGVLVECLHGQYRVHCHRSRTIAAAGAPRTDESGVLYDADRG